MPPANPVDLFIDDFPSEQGTAVSAVEFLFQQCGGNRTRYLRSASFQKCLHSLEFILGDNRLMAVLHEVFGLFSFIPHLPEWDVVGGEALLPDHIPSVGDIGEDIAYRGCVPYLSVPCAGDAQPVQLVCDILLALAAQVGGENAAHHLGLLRDDHQGAFLQLVAVGGCR
ncbi:hypothetical protein SDC9_122041 [bioreactor metagenome]|uniref:Uncharacterized protein n=1 Tax=bioreactor metagenome TaxID=1076179 RepID=A0A645CDP9_9ZZZZ